MIIVGAGSAGLYLAGSLKENSDKYEQPLILEEHSRLGEPVQCTGILTKDVEDILGKSSLNKFTVNKITMTRVHSPASFAEIKIQPNTIIDNVRFVEFLADRAERADAKILTSHRYLSNTGSRITVKNLKTGKHLDMHSHFLVGADGPNSSVALQNSLNIPRQNLLGLQFRMKIRNLDRNVIDFYPCIGRYAWCVPESEDVARVGIAVPLGEKNSAAPQRMLEDFAKKFHGKKIETQAGLIPLHIPGRRIEKHSSALSVALLGDAASQIKNTTGGGIMPGLKAAEQLSKGSDHYSKGLKSLNRELYLHYLLGKSLSRYSGKDWIRLIEKTRSEGVQTALEKYNRDNAGKLLLSLATKKGMLSEGFIAMSKLF